MVRYLVNRAKEVAVPPPSVREVLARVARELEDEETKDDLQELKSRKPTWEDVRDALANMPPEERAKVRALLIEEGAPVDKNGKGKGKAKKVDPTDDDDDDKDDDKPTPQRRARPGRKSGMAYDWYVDDDGNVVRDGMAHVFSGEDEPDEVEMLAADEETEEEE